MLDFQKRKKKYFDITLHDGTQLSLPTPTLKLNNDLQAMLETGGEKEVPAMVKSILETNRQGIEITQEHIQAFDVEDMIDLMMGYMEFTKGVLSVPNLKSLIAQQRTMRD